MFNTFFFQALTKLGLIEFIGGLTESLIMKVDENGRLAVALLLLLWVGIGFFLLIMFLSSISSVGSPYIFPTLINILLYIMSLNYIDYSDLTISHIHNVFFNLCLLVTFNRKCLHKIKVKKSLLR